LPGYAQHAQHVQREKLLTRHDQSRWLRRQQELSEWDRAPKQVIKPKKTALYNGHTVDAELYPAIARLNRLGITTEYSCAGVSMADDPYNHSLYAYVTLFRSELAEKYVQHIIVCLKHRVLVTFEPERTRYDLSSFFIGHNRSFCLLLNRYTHAFQAAESDCWK
jgi:hypothetical protein